MPKEKKKSFLKYITEQGIKDEYPSSLKRKIYITNNVYLFAIGITAFFLCFHFFISWKPTDYMVLTMLFLYTFGFGLNTLNLYNASRLAFVTLTNLEVFLFSFIHGEQAGIHFFFFPIICITAIIFEFKEVYKVIYSLLSSVIFIFILEYFDFQFFYSEAIPDNIQAIFHASALLMSILLTFLSVFYLFIAQRAADKEISYSKNLNNLINSIPEPIFVKNKENKRVLVNEAYCNLLGINKEDRLKLTDAQIYSKELAQYFKEEEERIFESGEGLTHEFRFTNKQGTTKTFITKKSLFVDESGETLIVGSLLDITDRKLAEEKIRHSENQLKETQELARIGSWEYNLETRKHKWSEETFRIFGLLPMDNLTPVIEYERRIHPDDIEEYRKALDNCIYFGKSFQQDHRIILSDSSIRYVNAKGKPILNSKGKVVKVLGSIMDITERKEAEIALSKSKKLFSSLVENSTDITTIIDIHGNIIYESPSFYKTLGFKEKEIMNESIFEFVHPEDRNDFLRFFSKVLQSSETPYWTEIRFQKANGSWIVLESVFSNLADDEVIGGVIVNSRDITERRKAEGENLEKSQILKGIISNMPVIVYKIDSHGFFTECIGAGLKITGSTENRLVGMEASKVYPQYYDEMQTAFEGNPVTFVASGINNNQEWFMENYVFQDNAKKEGLIGFAVDITDKKLAEKRQKEYSAELEKINGELDQFAHIVSHDLKAPLRAIYHLTSWIEEDLNDILREESRKNLNLLQDRVQKMQALISGILDYSKVSRLSPHFEEVDLGVLIQDIQEFLGVNKNFNIKVINPLPKIINNNIALQQIFSNLIGNAIKYHNKDQGNIEIGFNETPIHYEFFVSDDGPGIPAEYQEVIFGMFTTLGSKEKVESSGIGLAIVKKIIEEQGGKVWVDADYKKGAKFIFTLPKRNLS